MKDTLMPQIASPTFARKFARRWRKDPNGTLVEAIGVMVIVGMLAAIVTVLVVSLTGGGPNPSLVQVDLPDGRTVECLTYGGAADAVSCDWANATTAKD